MREVFTTGQVAKICQVAPRTVAEWFDSGRLKGYRIPGSPDRRVPREHLVRFLKEHGMPLGDLEGEDEKRILFVGLDETLVANLRERLSEVDGYKIETATGGFEAGFFAGLSRPDAVVIDLNFDYDEALQICRNLRRNSDTILIVLVGVEGLTGDELLEQGASEVFRKPFEPEVLAREIRTLVAERAHAPAS